jgi:hypothetical protein
MSLDLVFLLIASLFLFIAHFLRPSKSDQIKLAKDIDLIAGNAATQNSDIAIYRRFLASQFPIKLLGESDFQGSIKSIVGGNLSEGRIYIGLAHLVLDDYGYLDVLIGGKGVGWVPRADAKSFLSCVDGEDSRRLALVTPVLIMGGFMANAGDYSPYSCRLGRNATIIS